MFVLPWIVDNTSVPSLADLRELTLSKSHWDACNLQLELAQAVLKGKKHILLQAGCVMGKTLGFWVPLLAWASGFLIVVMPLTLLGDQHAKDLTKASISAININVTQFPAVHMYLELYFSEISKFGTND